MIKNILRLAYVAWGICIIIIIGYFITHPNANDKIENENSAPTPIQSSSVDFDTNVDNEISTKVIPTPAPTPTIVYPLSEYERWLVESIVTGESGNQPYDGKVAVASCILNSCIKDDIRPEEVQNKYGYAGWYDINEWENLYPDSAKEVKAAVSQVFDDGEVINFDIQWFYNPSNGYSSFHESLNYAFTIEDHKFFYK